jgi:hypothetical protein
MQILCAAGLVVSSLALASENIDPQNTGAQYAWGENTGWLNAEPSGDGGPGIFVEDDGLSGYLWSENTGWVSLSCRNGSSCNPDHQVTNDGAGNLAGYAWGENTGWISFSCTNTNSCGSRNYGVKINPVNGEFRGRAWSENTGWISFRDQSGPRSYGVTTAWTGEPSSCTPAPDPDLNDDGAVNILDISAVSSCIDQDPAAITQCAVADTNCDGAVDSVDLDFVSESYTPGGC